MLKCRKCGSLEKNNTKRFKWYVCSNCINQQITKRERVIKKVQALLKPHYFKTLTT